MPGPIAKSQMAVIGEFALCSKGRLGLVTELGMGKGATRTRIVAKGITLLPKRFSGLPWQSSKPIILHRLDGEIIERLTREE